MRRETGEESASPDSAKSALGEGARRAQSQQAETGCGEGMARPADGLEQIVAQAVPAGHQWTEEAAVGCRIVPQLIGCVPHLALQRDSSSIVQGMGEFRGGRNPVQAKFGERQAGKKRRGYRHGMNAEPRSCTNPCRVSSADREAPPATEAASSTSTVKPALANTMAAAKPFGPAPNDFGGAAHRSTSDSTQKGETNRQDGESEDV